jgi:rhomboid-like protein
MEQSAQKKAKKNQKPAETETEAEPAPEPEFEAVEVKPDPIYGRGKLDQIRERNIARRKAQEKLDEEERLAREAAGEVQSGPLAKVGEQQERQIANPRIAEYYAKATSDMQEPPQLSSLQRILPSATVVALVIGLLAAISTVYEEPADRYRLIPELTPAQATVGVIIGINAMVMLAWRVPPLWALLNRTMIFVVATPRPLTLFTAMFSHPRPSHLLVNMTVLWFIGTALHDELGRARFLTLFLGCGATGFLGSLVTYTLRGWLTTTTLGASGATLGLLAAYFWEHRDDGFRFGGLPENGVHGIVFLALIVALQLATLGKTVRLKIDVASHIAGLAAGLAGIQLLGRSRMGRAGAEGEARPKTVFNVIEAPGRDLPT